MKYYRYEQEGIMPYVTSIERRAEARGLVNGGRTMLLRLLARKFGELPEGVLGQINQLTGDQLEALGEKILDWVVIADLEHWLAENPAIEQQPDETSTETASEIF
jgi:hypothetical protein